MGAITSWLQTLSGPGVYAIVALLVFAEDGLFVGFVLPGETVAVLGGVIASRHNGVQLWALMMIVVGAAILGDSAGYEVGRRFGPALLETRPARRHREKIDRARGFIRDRGRAAVFLGRFVSFLRALVPTFAGAGGIRYRQFLAYNAAGGLVWGAGYTLLGYLAGSAYARVEATAGMIAAITAGALVLIALAYWAWRHRAKGSRDSQRSGNSIALTRDGPAIASTAQPEDMHDRRHGPYGEPGGIPGAAPADGLSPTDVTSPALNSRATCRQTCHEAETSVMALVRGKSLTTSQRCWARARRE